MGRRPRGWIVAAVLAAMWLGIARDARGQTGSTLTGTISDGQGAALVGVSVTLAARTILGEAQTTVTNGRGVYRFSQLSSGLYELTATRGSQTVKRTALRLPVGTTLTVDVAFGAANGHEIVTTIGAGSVVDVTRAASAIQFDRDELENLPVGGVFGLLQLDPGITPRSAFGSPLDANQLLIDGSPTVFTHRGTTSSAIHPFWIEAAQIVNLGASARSGEVGGVVTNIAIRSGSNRVSGLLEYRTAQPGWVADNTGSLPEALRAGFRPQEIVSRWAANGQAGGPIRRDRLFYFVGVSRNINRVLQAGTLGSVPLDTRSLNVLARLTWVASRNIRLDGFGHLERSRSKGALGRNQLPETAGDSRPRISDWNGRLTWTAGPRTIVEVRNNGLDYQFSSLDAGRRAGPPPHMDRITQILSGNAAGFSDASARRILTSAAITRFVESPSGGSHELEVGFEYDRTQGHTVSGIPGGRLYTDAAGVPDQVTLWDGDTVQSSGVRTSLYVQDVWKATRRLTIHPGVRIAFNRGSVPDKGRVFTSNPLSTRLGVAWDVARDHRTVVRAGYGRFHEGPYPTVFDFLNTSGLTPRIRARVLGPETFQELQRTATVTVALDDDVAHAYVDQFHTGIEREVLTNVTVTAQYIRRNFREIWAFIDKGSQYAPVERRDPGPDGRLGTTDDGPLITVFNLLNPGQSFPVLTNPAGAMRRYDAVQVIVEGRAAHNWQWLAAYTWSRTRGNVGSGAGENRASGADTGQNGVFFNPNRFINAIGRTAGDCPHQVNVQGTYFLPALGGLRLSGGYRYVSGSAWGRSATITGFSQGNQGIRLEPRGTRRNAATSQVDVRLEKTIPLGGSGRTMGIYADALNLTNQGVASSIQEMSGDAFGQPLQWTSPRTFQVAARIKF